MAAGDAAGSTPILDAFGLIAGAARNLDDPRGLVGDVDRIASGDWTRETLVALAVLGGTLATMLAAAGWEPLDAVLDRIAGVIAEDVMEGN